MAPPGNQAATANTNVNLQHWEDLAYSPKLHAACDVAGAGNVTMGAGLRATAKAAELPPDPTVGAPVLDPTVHLWQIPSGCLPASAEDP